MNVSQVESAVRERDDFKIKLEIALSDARVKDANCARLEAENAGLVSDKQALGIQIAQLERGAAEKDSAMELLRAKITELETRQVAAPAGNDGAKDNEIKTLNEKLKVRDVTIKTLEQRVGGFHDAANHLVGISGLMKGIGPKSGDDSVNMVQKLKDHITVIMDKLVPGGGKSEHADEIFRGMSTLINKAYGREMEFRLPRLTEKSSKEASGSGGGRRSKRSKQDGC